MELSHEVKTTGNAEETDNALLWTNKKYLEKI